MPRLPSLRAQITQDHRKGASQRVNGVRFSDTEIAWCVAYLGGAPAA